MNTIDDTVATAAGDAPGADRDTVDSSLPTEPLPDGHKPRLRGWLHVCMLPVAFVAGLTLVTLGPTLQARAASAVYVATSVLLFGVSAFYHRGRWTPKVADRLRRLDHANIFLIIAGTYTPFGVLALTGTARTIVLSVVWGGALFGVLFRVVWLSAPRALYVALYVALGWVAIFFIPQFVEGAGLAAFILVAAGGVLYSMGAVVYGLRRPDPHPGWFGYHEVFHSFTIAAWITQYVAVSLVVYGAT